MLTRNALKHFGGSQAALARAIGITRGAVHQWGRVVPEGAAYKIESITKGAIRVNRKLYRKAPISTGASQSILAG